MNELKTKVAKISFAVYLKVHKRSFSYHYCTVIPNSFVSMAKLKKTFQFVFANSKIFSTSVHPKQLFDWTLSEIELNKRCDYYHISTSFIAEQKTKKTNLI